LNYALLLLVLFIVSALALLFVVHALWSEEQPETKTPEPELLETVPGAS
jgi:hypothetical protein